MINTNVQWKVVDGFPRYSVSNDGRALSHNYRNTGRPGLLKPCLDSRGYYQVKLYYAPNEYSIELLARLIAKAFIENPSNLPEVNHIDQNRLNNHVSNLEWISKQDNLIHCGRGKLTELEARLVRWWYAQCEDIAQTAFQFDLTYNHVWAIVNGKRWRNIGAFGNLRDQLRQSGLAEPWPKRSNINPKPAYCDPTPKPIHLPDRPKPIHIKESSNAESNSQD